MNIQLEQLLAALIDQNDGELFLGIEYAQKDYEGKAIALDADALRDGIAMTLMNVEDINYDDE